MFHVVYRWRIHPGHEAAFVEAWAEMTELIRTHRGGLGSRLHRAEDGLFVAYAQWPDRETWERSPSIPLPENQAAARMKEAVASSEPPLLLTTVADLLAQP